MGLSVRKRQWREEKGKKHLEEFVFEPFLLSGPGQMSTAKTALQNRAM